LQKYDKLYGAQSVDLLVFRTILCREKQLVFCHLFVRGRTNRRLPTFWVW